MNQQFIKVNLAFNGKEITHFEWIVLKSIYLLIEIGDQKVKVCFVDQINIWILRAGFILKNEVSFGLDKSCKHIKNLPLINI